MDCHKAQVAVCISIRIMYVRKKPSQVHPVTCVTDSSHRLRRKGRWPALGSWGQPWLGSTRPGLGMRTRGLWLLHSKGGMGWTWQLGELSPPLSEVTYHLPTWYPPSGLNDTKSSEKSIQSDSRRPRAIETFYNESGL